MNRRGLGSGAATAVILCALIASGAGPASASDEPKPTDAAAAQAVDTFVASQTSLPLPTGDVDQRVVIDQVGGDNGATVTVTTDESTRSVEVLPVRQPDGSVNEALSPSTTVQVLTGFPRQTVFGNLTVVGPLTNGWTTAWPCDQPRPNASTNNYTAGMYATPNFTAVATDAAGTACFYTFGIADLLWDQYGATTRVEAGAPVRDLDTRTSWFAPPSSTPRTGKVGAGSFAGTTQNGPGTTILGNLTVTEPDGGGFTSAYPCSSGPTPTSVNNYLPGETTPNFAMVQADGDGNICFSSKFATHLVWDRIAQVSRDVLPAHPAQRLLDTRTINGGSRPRAGAVTRVSTSLPNTTVFGNLTVTDPAGVGYTTIYDCGVRPVTSVNNYVATEVTPNFAAVKTNGAGEFCIYSTQAAHVIWDQVAETTAFSLGTTTRLLDTRLDKSGAPDASHWAPMSVVNGQVVRWDPCTKPEISVYVNWNGMYAERPLMDLAIARIRAASGLNLVYRDVTTVMPRTSTGLGFSDPARMPGQDLIIAFGTAGVDSDPLPGAGVLGYAGPHWSRAHIIYGAVWLNKPAMLGYSWNSGLRATVYMHEIAHAVGLNHFNDVNQVMNPSIQRMDTFWGNGDATGLTAVGATQGCIQ